MTGPRAPSSRPLPKPRWYARPGIVLPLVFGIMVASAIFAPEGTAGRSGDPRLTTHNTSSQGARLFHDLAEDLGWSVARRETDTLVADPTVIHAVLSPALVMRRQEAHALLEHVRAGGALLVVLRERGDPLGDSLRVVGVQPGGSPVIAAADTAGCARPTGRTFPPLWEGERASLYQLRWRRIPEGMETLLAIEGDGAFGVIRTPSGRVVVPPPPSAPRSQRGRPAQPARPLAAMVGFPLGKGRVVVGSDPDLLRNDALRVCGFGLDVPAVRALEYLRDGGAPDTGPRTRIVFDEFHHGFGPQPGAMKAIVRYLGSTPSGHGFAQLLVAGLVLLAALAPRIVRPAETDRIERRSPLEHVDALARAYERVHATRTATARLVRGLRRRLHHGGISGSRGETDAAFLSRAAVAKPAVGPDVARIRRALAEGVTRKELEGVGASLQKVESSLTRM